MIDRLVLQPVSFKQACEYITTHHRHHKPPQGWKFGVGVSNGEKLVGVVMIGRPIARMLDDGYTLEVIRLCTDGTPNASSLLYGAAWRAAKALGFKRLVTYILESETGVSIKAAGWQEVGSAGGGSWSRPSRPREDKAPLVRKTRWEVVA